MTMILWSMVNVKDMKFLWLLIYLVCIKYVYYNIYSFLWKKKITLPIFFYFSSFLLFCKFLNARNLVAQTTCFCFVLYSLSNINNIKCIQLLKFVWLFLCGINYLLLIRYYCLCGSNGCGGRVLNAIQLECWHVYWHICAHAMDISKLLKKKNI